MNSYLSDENIDNDILDSDSEQNISNEEVKVVYTDELNYTGKYKVGKWQNTEFTSQLKTKKYNIIKISRV